MLARRGRSEDLQSNLRRVEGRSQPSLVRSPGPLSKWLSSLALARHPGRRQDTYVQPEKEAQGGRADGEAGGKHGPVVADTDCRVTIRAQDLQPLVLDGRTALLCTT